MFIIMQYHVTVMFYFNHCRCLQVVLQFMLYECDQLTLLHYFSPFHFSLPTPLSSPYLTQFSVCDSRRRSFPEFVRLCVDGRAAKGRTNVELREQFILAEGVSQSMAPFKAKPSPNSSVSSQSGTPQQRSQSLPGSGPIIKVCGNDRLYCNCHYKSHLLAFSYDGFNT